MEDNIIRESIGISMEDKIVKKSVGVPMEDKIVKKSVGVPMEDKFAKKNVGITIEEKLIKKRRLQYIKGLFLRIILACAIFILLFLGNQFSVNLFDYNTDKVVMELQNNTLMESIENKITSIFPKEESLNLD